MNCVSLISCAFVILSLVTSGYAKKIAYGQSVNLEKDKCTAIGVGPKGMKDGSTVTTHNNDCQECDFRITHVPARDWPKGSKRQVTDIRNAYPRYVETSADNIHGPDYLRSSSYPDPSLFNWNNTPAFAYIDQVEHTYAYTLGTYALQNEKQVSIGESTCSSKFVGRPIFAGGKAMMHMETLTEIALERCDSARCAIQLMGDLGVKHGFYGPEWDAGPLSENAQDEAGEALVVSDAKETWMFHIMPDDTGASAIWVAQKVPDDHITVVANQFVIGQIDLKSTDFMASTNIYEVAERNNFWSAADQIPFHFSRVYGNDRHRSGFGCTRRMWRVFTLAAPSLAKSISAFTDAMTTFGVGPDMKDPYPFSVKVDKPLTVQDIMNINRDQFEGSLFDLTAGVDAGPFGDPMRFPPLSKWADKSQGVEWSDYAAGVGFERPISLWRTAYSSITQSRADLPDLIGAVTWIAQYAPHHSSFVPVYASADHTPSSLNTGTQFKVDKQANWWVHCITGNYLSRWYRYTIEDVRAFQKTIEEKLMASQAAIEKEALSLMTIPSVDAFVIPKMLWVYHERTASQVREEWWSFFFKMAGTYRDMYKVTNTHVENFAVAYRYLGVPRWWFEQIGFWGQLGASGPSEKAPYPVRHFAFPTENSLEAYRAKYPRGYNASVPYYGSTLGATATEGDYINSGYSVLPTISTFVSAIVGMCVGCLITVLYFQHNNKYVGYTPLH